MDSTQVRHHDARNTRNWVGREAPFNLKEIRAIQVPLAMQGRLQELDFSALGIDSKHRAGDLLSLRVCDACHGDRVAGPSQDLLSTNNLRHIAHLAAGLRSYRALRNGQWESAPPPPVPPAAG